MHVDSLLRIQTNELTERQWRSLFGCLRYMDDEKEIYEPWKIDPSAHEVTIPRGAWFQLPDSIVYHDDRLKPEGREFDFTAELDAEGFSGQKDALRTMLEQEQGIIVGQPGFGKTNVALAFASCCETPTLILVHTEDILEQWRDRAAAIIPDAKVGVIRGAELEIGDITIATVQTFHKRLQHKGANKLKQAFGCVILDEAHHAPASTFDEILNQMPAHYRFGFTATDKRADKKHPYMATVIGPVIFRKKFKSKVPVKVTPLKTKFFYRYRGSWDWRNLLNALISDEGRNAQIAEVVLDRIDKGHSTLVLSREVKHLQAIHAAMDEDQRAVLFTAQTLNKKERKETLVKFRAGEIKCLLATQLADEALDVPILSRVVLTFPGKHAGRIIQQVGRALREHEGKEDAEVIDVVDDKVSLLRRQWMERKQAYKQMDISIRKTKRRN